MKKFNLIKLGYYSPSQAFSCNGITYLVGDNNTGKTKSILIAKLLYRVADYLLGHNQIDLKSEITFEMLDFDFSKYGIQSINELVSILHGGEAGLTFGDYDICATFIESGNGVKVDHFTIDRIYFSDEEIQDENGPVELSTQVISWSDGELRKGSTIEVKKFIKYLVFNKMRLLNEINQEYLSTIALRFYIDNDVTKFIKTWMKEFKIGVDYRVTDDGVLEVFDEEGTQISLGRGYSNLMYFIISVAFMLDVNDFDTDSLVIVLPEIPEFGLHPNLQSKLADFFWQVSQEYGVQFVVETHSEYLIRESQVIVAKECKSGRTVEEVSDLMEVYEFSKDGSTELIGYRDDGRTVHNFTPGFTDIAYNLYGDLIKIKNQK